MSCRRSPYASKIKVNREYLIKGLAISKPTSFITALDTTGVLEDQLAEIAAMKYCSERTVKSTKAPVTTFDHALLTLQAISEFSDDPLLRLAALLHDCGKPSVCSLKENDIPSFHGHEVEGAEIAVGLMKRLGFHERECGLVYHLIVNHMFYFPHGTSDKAIRVWVLKTGQYWRYLLLLRIADRKGNPNRMGRPVITKELKDLLKRVHRLRSTGKLFFPQDLALKDKDLFELGIKSLKTQQRVLKDIVGMLMQHPERNTKESLIAYMGNLQYVKKSLNAHR